MRAFDALLGRTAGVAEVRNTSLVFTSDADGRTLVLPFVTLVVTLEGANSQHYYFFDVHRPSDRVCIQDARVLDVLARAGVPAALRVAGKARTRRGIRVLAIGSPLAVSFVLLLAIPFLLSLIPTAWLARVLSPTQERALGRALFPMIRLQHAVQEDHPAIPKVRALIDHLRASSAELAALETEVYVSTSLEVNAFAAPGNIVVVNRGLIEKAGSIEEVLGVVAHELGHVEQKHAIKSLTGALGSVVGTVVLGSIVGSDAALVVARASNFAGLKYSRDDEEAADRRAVAFLTAAKISPRGMIEFFERLAAEEGAVAGVLRFVSTHPASADRARKLYELSAVSPPFQAAPPPITLEELRAAFREPTE